MCGKDKLIGYWSRQLIDAEKHYSATKREALAITWGTLQLRLYLQSHPFVVESDQSACQILFRQVSSNRLLTKRRFMLSDFVFDVRHRSEKDNLAADAMSRQETEGADASAWDLDIPTLLVELESAVSIDPASMVPIALSKLLQAQQHDDEVLTALMRGRLHGIGICEDDDGLIVRKVERVGLPPLLQAWSLRYYETEYSSWRTNNKRRFTQG